MNLVCKMLGGSHSYGLNTPASDVDNRGVFLNNELRFVLGLDKQEHQEYTEGGADDKFKEFRAYMNLLRQGNTEALEMLFNDDWLEVSPLFQKLQSQRLQLLDSTRLYKCLCGYMEGELKLATGQRKGKLGGKRKEAVDKYGFSPKNFVQLFRLAWAGVHFFNYGEFPVNVMKKNPELGAKLLDVKTKPENYTVEELSDGVTVWGLKLAHAYENRKENYEFNRELADRFVLEAYMPFLQQQAHYFWPLSYKSSNQS